MISGSQETDGTLKGNIVIYRRTEYPEADPYNTSTTQYGGEALSLIQLGFQALLRICRQLSTISGGLELAATEVSGVCSMAEHL